MRWGEDAVAGSEGGSRGVEFRVLAHVYVESITKKAGTERNAERKPRVDEGIQQGKLEGCNLVSCTSKVFQTRGGKHGLEVVMSQPTSMLVVCWYGNKDSNQFRGLQR